MTTSRGPNPASVASSVIRSLLLQRRPNPDEASTVHIDHARLANVLEAMKGHGVDALLDHRASLAAYRTELEAVDPDSLGTAEALAFWLNLYNAGALDLAAEARAAATPNVLRIPGGFARTWATVAGRELSLDAIEHAKIRRFKDPRVHGALVCGSASCPTLRYEPFAGAMLDDQLDNQMRDFFANGGAVVNEGTLYLSRILLWFGGDFVRPHRMPSFLPVTKAAVARAVAAWLPSEAADIANAQGGLVGFQPYDWSLSCSIG